ncbi:MAG: exodeoxyribonuclease VII large subunit [Tannerella sp.]|jgi:exodeoxyribonuclease VII large subunit|nr:exodeoxyribonuclease VII large subunit [Tannerella sp.]
MAEIIKDKQVFSLTEVLISVKNTLEKRYTSAFWVKAEMNKLNFYRQSGHCYPDLVEKLNGKVVAQMRAILWSNEYRHIDEQFRLTLNEPLKDGIKILFYAKIMFEPAHGLNLHILDIDPSYTLGDLEKEKQDTIRRLREEGIYNANKSLKIAALPQRIAIISVETSKGYQDFVGKIETNTWRYAFFRMLFPSVLQGDGIVKSISLQLNRIRKVIHHFDAVAIIRGGGGEVGLASYNNYELAKEIALFPLPVLTGIGHITNETVTEMVAWKNLITPTDLADFFLQSFHNCAVPVEKAQQRISDMSARMLRNEKQRLTSLSQLFRSAVTIMVKHNANNITLILSRITNGLKRSSADKSNRLIMLRNMLSESCRRFVRDKNMQLDTVETTVKHLNPREVMKRGYSMTVFNGMAVKNASTLKTGDMLKTVLFEGEIESTVNQSYPQQN